MTLEPVEGHSRWLEDTDVVPGRNPTYYLDLAPGRRLQDRRAGDAAAYLWEHQDGGGPYVLVVRGYGTVNGDEPDGTFSDRSAAFLTAEGFMIARDEERRAGVQTVEPNVYILPEPATDFTIAGRRFIPSGRTFGTKEEAKRARDSLNEGEGTLFPGARTLAVVVRLGPSGPWAVFISRRAGTTAADQDEERRRRPPPGTVVQRGLEAGGTGQAMFQAPARPRPRELSLLERERARQAQVRGPAARQDVLMELDRFEQDKKQRRLA